MERYELMNVIIMGVYTAVTAGMLIALACQISIARKSSHQELRAYVMGEMSSIINIADPLDVAEEDRTLAALKFPNNGPVAQMKIINAGKTPAYYVRHWGDMGFREYPLTGPLAEVGRTGMPMPIVLGPQISSTKLYRNIPPTHSGPDCTAPQRNWGHLRSWRNNLQGCLWEEPVYAIPAYTQLS